MYMNAFNTVTFMVFLHNNSIVVLLHVLLICFPSSFVTFQTMLL